MLATMKIEKKEAWRHMNTISSLLRPSDGNHSQNGTD
jgi:hypothetical protein